MSATYNYSSAQRRMRSPAPLFLTSNGIAMFLRKCAPRRPWNCVEDISTPNGHICAHLLGRPRLFALNRGRVAQEEIASCIEVFALRRPRWVRCRERMVGSVYLSPSPGS